MSNHPLKDPKDLTKATELINEYAWSDQTSFHFVDHAVDRLDERSIEKDWVTRVLREGEAVSYREHTNKQGKTTYRYKVKYVAVHGDSVVITIIPRKNALTIITEW